MRLTPSLVFWAAILLLALVAAFVYVAPRVGTTTSANRDANTPGDWPMLGHDVSRTSFNPHERALSATNIDSLVPRWRAVINPEGIPAGSAPSVANGRVYIGGSAHAGPNFFAFEASSGAPLWQVSLGYASTDCSAEGIEVGIGSTAAILGSIVVVGGGDAAYYGLDADTGATLWRDPLDVGPSGFAWASPLLAHGRAYYGAASHCDNPSVRGEVRSVDLGSGRHLARLFVVPNGKAGGGVWHAPTLSPDARTLVVATGEDFEGHDGPLNRALVSLDALSLDVIQADKQGALNDDQDWGSTPVIFNDSQGRTLVAASHKDGAIRVYAIDDIKAGPIWARHENAAIAMTPAYDPTFGQGGTLFFEGYKDTGSHLYAVDPTTGADRWTPVPLPDYTLGNMAIANGLIFLNLNGALHVYDEHTGTLLRAIEPEDSGPSWTGPAVSHGFVYWTSGAYLNAWSLPDTATVTPEP
ncbi:MAG: PQQ-binding-like beta-propeller repeat protein [Chloroflexota bacterium]|nr:PQQ-binding-like beta-propeller repeat protein [Chloroflexota bacterium]MDQ5864579.1 PQQ-binding-like beta-propeller repeat protein [Chloroflexota bacterium]